MKTLILTLLVMLMCSPVRAEEIGTASWYSVESCKQEGTSGVMANGSRLKDNEKTCASWDYPFGSILRCTALRTGQSVLVEVTDRGPNKKLYAKGRIIDLSKRAFSEIAPLEQGVIPCRVEEVE